MKNTIKTYILRSIDPWSGFMKDFMLEPDEPVLIGRMSLKIVLDFPKGFLINTPEEEVENLSDYIKSAKRLIKPEDCKIRGNPISSHIKPRMKTTIKPPKKSFFQGCEPTPDWSVSFSEHTRSWSRWDLNVLTGFECILGFPLTQSKDWQMYI